MNTKVKAFAITQLGSQAQLIVHFEEGFDTVLEMDFDELKELAILSKTAFEQMLDEDRADADAESRFLNEQDERLEYQREAMAEMDFDRHGYNDIPF